MKRCTVCHVTKDISEFHKAKRYSDGHVAKCKVCTLRYHKQWYQTHLGYRTAQIKIWREANPARCNRYHLKTELKKYGLTIPQYETMLSAQDGKCKICGTTKPGARFKRLVVDHDKETGQVRGLLCDRCNRGIGLLLHNADILKAAVAYIS